MTAAAQTALAFARECLEWDGANMPYGAASVLHSNGLDRFIGSDLYSVLNAVRTWSAEHHISVDVKIGPQRYAVWIRDRYGRLLGDDFHIDPCQALMAACVAAARRLKGPHPQDDARPLPR